MSKSKGNGIDPVDIIDLYGADALRFTPGARSATETQDLRMPVEKAKLPDGRVVNTSERFEQGRTFPNKFWNAARFALMNLEDYDPRTCRLALDFRVEDRWILEPARTHGRARRPTTSKNFRFAEAAKTTPRLHLERLLRLVRRDCQGPAPRPAKRRADRPARSRRRARRPLPAPPPDHAVRDRAGLAGSRSRSLPARRPSRSPRRPPRAFASRPGRSTPDRGHDHGRRERSSGSGKK